MSGDQFALYDPPFMKGWRDRLSDPKPAKPAKVKPKPRKKGKRKAKK